MKLKTPLSIQQQITKLKEHGMIIHDEHQAELFLSKVNYYRFTGYALAYRVETHNSNYLSNTDFDTIRQIYEFDTVLRNLLRKYIETSEVYFRTKISYVFSLRKCALPPHDQHYYPQNYYRTDKFIELIKRISAEEDYFQDSAIIKHHKEIYENKMPLWVLVEIMTISTLSKLYSCMYYSKQEAIAQSVKTSARILKNNLHALSIIRNKCAHAARLYNDTLSLPIVFNRQFLRCNPDIKTNTLFAYIVMIYKRLPDISTKNEFKHNLFAIIKQYDKYIDKALIGFPDKWEKFF